MIDRISRRDFLKLSAVAAVSATLSACEVDFSAKAHDREVSFRISKFLKDEFKMKDFYFGNGYIANSRDTHSKPLEFGNRTGIVALQEIHKALNFYPVELFDNISNNTPWSYLISEDLTYFNTDSGQWEDWAGTVTRNAFQAENIVVCERGRIEPLTHHEIFHLIEKTVADNLSLYSQLRLLNAKYGLEPHSFSNFDSARSCSDSPPPKGFARCYGRRTPSEDAGTVAEGLLTVNPEFIARIKTEPALHEKTELVKSIYEEASSGKMNKYYFDALASGTLENPWNRHQIPESLYQTSKS